MYLDNGDNVIVEIKGDVTVSGGSEEQASEPNYKVLNVGDVLRIVDTLTAINNFTAANAGIRGTENVMGAGIVSFGNMFADSINATVEVPVAANVSAGQTYTVVFSDGTSIEVPCTMAGVLSIPFNKNAEGLTYMIYGPQMNPAMFIGMQPGAGF